MFACIRFYFRFSVLWLSYYTCSYPAFPYVFYSSSLLLLSYHTLSISCLISIAVYLLAPHACAHDTIFNACLWFRFIDTRVLIYARYLAFASPLAGEFWVLWILLSRFWSLECVNSLSCWSEWRSWSVNPQQTRPEPYPFRPPCSALEFSCYDSEPPFVLFILVHPSYSRICAILVM